MRPLRDEPHRRSLRRQLSARAAGPSRMPGRESFADFPASLAEVCREADISDWWACPSVQVWASTLFLNFVHLALRWGSPRSRVEAPQPAPQQHSVLATGQRFQPSAVEAVWELVRTAQDGLEALRLCFILLTKPPPSLVRSGACVHL